MEAPPKNRCKWCNQKNPLYVNYHDYEWGRIVHNDQKLFEMLLLESFQAGLSWECILNKREAFRKAFDDFDYNKIATYDNDKIELLLQDKGIIRNKSKITATIWNAKIFIQIQAEFESFDKYIWSFTNQETIYECNKTSSPLSDTIAKDLKKRGMRFFGTTIIYSFLQAVGIINSHEENCWVYTRL